MFLKLKSTTKYFKLIRIKLVALFTIVCIIILTWKMNAPKHTSTLINTPLMSSVQFIGEKLLAGSSSDKLFYLLEIQADHSVKVLKSFGEFVRTQQKLSARQTFVSLDKRGTTAATGSSASKTFHTKHISKIQMHDNKFSASSFDKKISIWSYWKICLYAKLSIYLIIRINNRV